MSHRDIGLLMIFTPLFLGCFVALWYALYELFERDAYECGDKDGQDWRAHLLVLGLFGWVGIAILLIK